MQIIRGEAIPYRVTAELPLSIRIPRGTDGDTLVSRSITVDIAKGTVDKKETRDTVVRRFLDLIARVL